MVEWIVARFYVGILLEGENNLLVIIATKELDLYRSHVVQNGNDKPPRS